MGDITRFPEARPGARPSIVPVPVRLRDWKEVYEEFPLDDLQIQASRCMDCGIPFCNDGCPLGNIIPDWNDLTYRGHWDQAMRSAARHEQLPRLHGSPLSGTV